MRTFFRSCTLVQSCVLVATLNLGACRSDLATTPQTGTPTITPSGTLAATVAALQCHATVASGAVTCGGVSTALGGSLSNLTVGGQGTHLTLTSSNVSYAGTTYQFDVTVRNLMAQPIGTTDGSSADASGIRVVLASAPTVTIGTGSITAQNADGTGAFTAPNQSYWQYTGNLATNTTSASKTWRLTVPNTVTSFTFTVFVQAAIPNETGILRWTAPTSGTLQNLRSVSCASATACVAVGEGGVVLTTTNGGASWTKQNGAPSDTRGVSCASETACVAVGSIGTIATTENGGISWTTRTSGTTSTLFGVSCPSAMVCVAVGNTATPLTSVDGGTSWTPQSSGTGFTLSNVSCSSVSACVAVGFNVRKTDNGGTSWTTRPQGPSQSSKFNAISCWNESPCVAVGNYGAIGKIRTDAFSWSLGYISGTTTDLTTDGSSWSLVTSSGTTADLTSVACGSTTACVAVGSDGLILSSADGGETWNTRTTVTANILRAVSCPSATVCVAVGDGGTIRVSSR